MLFVGTSIIHPSTEGVFLLCNILDLIIYSSNIGVPSLQEYIVFLYPGLGLAVFESFVPGNAYYAFRYTEFEKLLNQVSTLTKTQMLMNSAFLNRGYHLQDNVKTKEKINLLFAQK